MDLQHRPRGRRLSRIAAVAITLAMAVTLSPASATGAPAPPDQSAGTRAWVGGKQLYQAVVDPRTNIVYVAAYGDSAIYLYDGATGQQKGRFDLPGTGPMGLALNQTTNTLYATSSRDETIQALDATTGRVKALIRPPAGTQSREIRVDEATNRFYVTETHEAQLLGGALAEYDGATNTLLRKMPTSGSWAAGLALDTARKLAYVTNFMDDDVVVIDLAGGAVLKRVETGAGSRPTGLAFDPVTKHLFITLQAFGQVEILDTATGHPIGEPVSTGAGALGVSVDPATGRAYVTNFFAQTLSVLDARTGTKVYDVPGIGEAAIFGAVNTSTHDVWVIGGGRDSSSDTVTKVIPGPDSGRIVKQTILGEVKVVGTAVNPVNNLVYVADVVNSTVPSTDGATGKHGPRLMVPHPPTDLALNLRTGTLYTASSTARTVDVLDLGTGKVKATLSVPYGSPAHLRVDEQHNRFYVTVASAQHGSVLEFNGANNTLVRQIPTGGLIPTGLALDPAAGRLFVTNLGSDNVAVINLATGKVERLIDTGHGSHPTDVAFNAKTKRIYVTLTGLDKILTINTETYRPVGPPADSTGTPVNVAVDVAAGRVYVTNSSAGTLSVLDATTGEKLSVVTAVGGKPTSVAVNTTTHEVWVTAGGLPEHRDTLTKVSAPPPPH